MSTSEPRPVFRNMAVAVACLSNILSVVGIFYHSYRAEQGLASIPISYHLLIVLPLWLSPIAVVLIGRKISAIVYLYAFVLFGIFLGRVYFLLPSSITGNTWYNRPHDWSDLLQTFVGALSVLVLAIMLVVGLIERLTGWSPDGPRR
jgi:hypothetical protein